MQKHLTEIAVKKLPEGTYHDTQVPAFGVRIGKRRITWFYVELRSRKRVTLGHYPGLSLADARKEAKKRMANGQPLSAGTTTVSDALTAYYADCEQRITKGALVEYRRHLRKLPDKPLSEINRSHIDVGDAHAVNACRVFFNWCIKNGFTDKNPFLHIPVRYGQRERVLTPDEIRAVWQYEYPPYTDIVKLLLLTGQRRGEIMALQPHWISGDTVTLPATVTKNRKEHTFPFGELTAEYLQKVPFAFKGWGNGQKRMYRETGVTDFVLHDLRRTCATLHVQIGTPVHVTEAILNHSSGSISGIAKVYIRANLLADMRTACLKYEKHLSTIISP